MNNDPGEKQQCRRCGASMGAHARFCEECGAAVAAPVVGRTCRACGATLGPAARFCPRCGAPVRAAWAPGFHAGWGRLRARAAAVDWVRAGRVAAPVAALLIAGLVGYGVGHGTAGPPSPRGRVVSAARGWRAVAPPISPVTSPAVRTPESASGLAAGVDAAGRPAAAPVAASPPVRFRDFHVSASSYELANPPAYVSDGDPYTAWHAWETERYPEGDWLTLTLPTARLITRLGLIPGRVGPRANIDGSVRSLLVKAPGVRPQKLLFADRPQLQYRDLKTPVFTRELTLRIVNVVPGTRSRHIIIPEIQVWGYPAPSRIAHR